MSEPKKVSSSELRGAIGQVAPFSNPDIPDRDYSFPTKDWLSRFNRWFRYQMKKMVGDEWDRKFDCDDFSRLFAAFASIAHRQTNKIGTGEGLALGEVWFIRDNGEGHAINLVFTEDGPTFIEPQTGEEIQLSPNERASIFFTRF